MSEVINIENVRNAFVQSASNKYEVEDLDSNISNLMGLAPVQLTEIGILRLKRKTNFTGYWKTLIFVILESVDEFPLAFNWIASIKEDLLDPESSDLYFIGGVKDSSISQELCTNIESGDQFCRKYILRPGETISSLIDRTFLANLTESSVEQEIVDPLYMAIQQTAKRLPSFSDKQQEYWRDKLLSGNSGAELIDQLFKQSPISTKPDVNETP